MNGRMKQIALPLLTAMIWGSAFVAQKDGAEVLGPFGFTGARYALAALALFGFLKARSRRTPAAERTTDRRALLRNGLVLGTLIALGSTLQQYGVERTTAGKAGFITALYIVLVPLLGLFFGNRVRIKVWCGVAVALAGLYFLSFAAGGAPAFNSGDVFVLLCTLAFSVHILCVDRFTRTADPVELSCAQFAVAAAETLALALVFEGLPLADVARCMPFLLYTGVVSGALGYTLQIVAQKDGDPTVVSLLLSLESFFAVVSGALLLNERLTAREYAGCALMLCAVVLVQLPEKTRAHER